MCYPNENLEGEFLPFQRTEQTPAGRVRRPIAETVVNCCAQVYSISVLKKDGILDAMTQLKDLETRKLAATQLEKDTRQFDQSQYGYYEPALANSGGDVEELIEEAQNNAKLLESIWKKSENIIKRKFEEEQQVLVDAINNSSFLFSLTLKGNYSKPELTIENSFTLDSVFPVGMTVVKEDLLNPSISSVFVLKNNFSYFLDVDLEQKTISGDLTILRDVIDILL